MPIRSRSSNGRAVRDAATVEQDIKAWDMRVSRMTYPEIAKVLKLTTEGARQSALRGAALIPTPDAIEGKQRELDELEKISRHCLAVMKREHVQIRDGEAVTFDGSPVLDDGPGLQAVRELVNTQKRRSALMGWDEPKKHEVSGPGGGPVQMEVFGAELASRIAKSDEAAERMRLAAKDAEK